MSDKAEKKKDEKPAEAGHGEMAKKGGISRVITTSDQLLTELMNTSR